MNANAKKIIIGAVVLGLGYVLYKKVIKPKSKTKSHLQELCDSNPNSATCKQYQQYCIDNPNASEC